MRATTSHFFFNAIPTASLETLLRSSGVFSKNTPHTPISSVLGRSERLFAISLVASNPSLLPAMIRILNLGFLDMSRVVKDWQSSMESWLSSGFFERSRLLRALLEAVSISSEGHFVRSNSEIFVVSMLKLTSWGHLLTSKVVISVLLPTAKDRSAGISSVWIVLMAFFEMSRT